jgi:two-component system, OmpR family, response regulator ChvI
MHERSCNISSQPLLPSSTKTEGKKRRILIVDDDPDITNSFSLCLEDTGLFEVETYNDSALALSNFKSNSFDILLLDIRMPKMNGFELCDKIKELDRNVRVCFISGFYTDYNALSQENPSLEVECFIPKPIQIAELVKRIETELLR